MAVITPIPLEQILGLGEDLECFHDDEYIAGMCGCCGQSTVDFCPVCRSYILNGCLDIYVEKDGGLGYTNMFKCSHCDTCFVVEMV